jgi:hypothetical protein
MQEEEDKSKLLNKLQLFILDLLVLDKVSKANKVKIRVNKNKDSKANNIARLYMRMEEICLRRRRALVGRF